MTEYGQAAVFSLKYLLASMVIYDCNQCKLFKHHFLITVLSALGNFYDNRMTKLASNRPV